MVFVPRDLIDLITVACEMVLLFLNLEEYGWYCVGKRVSFVVVAVGVVMVVVVVFGLGRGGALCRCVFLLFFCHYHYCCCCF